MKKSGIEKVGTGNANENGEALAAGVLLTEVFCEVDAGAGGRPPVPGGCFRGLAGRTRQFVR
jgi:hypothetical protein